MSVINSAAMRGFTKTAYEGYLKGWHERNGGNMSYRLSDAEACELKGEFTYDRPWTDIGTEVPLLGGTYFIVTGSGRFFSHAIDETENAIGIIELDGTGRLYRIVWGLDGGGRPTSELPSHLMNHEVKLRVTGGRHRLIYHAHPVNLIALTFILPLDSAIFTRKLWEAMTECPIVFPSGVGVVPWMVPGGREIAVETSRLMKRYDAAVWAHHGIFCSGEGFDDTFGMMHVIEKAAEILIKIYSVAPRMAQTITAEDFRALASAFGVTLNEDVLYDPESIPCEGKLYK